ncbi:protein of unknown function (plasmid) [Candidatus Promineifilum breve]|uniref:Uncharacterized protein n=1 Tax=Candidatus Promineifilum breve TaxID=1806508 RepID=A0A160T8N4_9CHLR|nr:protein of unknown function [Candidatus Promineifilum breve]
MTAKAEFPDTDNLIRRYQSGESLYKLASEKGVTPKVIARIMREAGVLESRQGLRIDLDIESIIAHYLAGESEKAISDSLGVNRWTIRRRLQAAGIEPRGRSEAELLKWSQMTAEQKRQQVAPAHDAVRGVPVPHARKVKIAKGKERMQGHAVAAERHLAQVLTDRGLTVTLQRAVDKYNIDIAIDSPPVAVEIFGGGWHSSGDHARRFFERTKYFLDCGWNVVIVWVDGRRYPVGVGCADYVAAFVQELGGDISGRGQYRVILGDGQDAPATDSYFNSLAVIERLRGG